MTLTSPTPITLSMNQITSAGLSHTQHVLIYDILSLFSLGLPFPTRALSCSFWFVLQTTQKRKRTPANLNTKVNGRTLHDDDRSLTGERRETADNDTYIQHTTRPGTSQSHRSVHRFEFCVFVCVCVWFLDFCIPFASSSLTN